MLKSYSFATADYAGSLRKSVISRVCGDVIEGEDQPGWFFFTMQTCLSNKMSSANIVWQQLILECSISLLVKKPLCR